MLDFGENIRDHLDATAAKADDGHLLAFELGTLVVIGGMAKCSLEAVESLDLGPVPGAVRGSDVSSGERFLQLFFFFFDRRLLTSKCHCN